MSDHTYLIVINSELLTSFVKKAYYRYDSKIYAVKWNATQFKVICSPEFRLLRFLWPHSNLNHFFWQRMLHH